MSNWRVQEGDPSIVSIQTATARHFGIRMIEMRSARRTWDVVRPRQVAMYLARNLTDRSLPVIGREFGGREHSTVSHAIKWVEQKREADPDFDAKVADLEQAISW